MHDVDALIAKADNLTAAVGRFGTAIVCSLAQGFSLVPITDVLEEELVVHQPRARDVLTKPLGQCALLAQHGGLFTSLAQFAHQPSPQNDRGRRGGRAG
jgi:hypothetical protein